MDTLTISRIMVQNKCRFPVSKGDLAVYVVDIPKAAGLLNDLMQQELHKCHVSLSLPPISELFDAWCKETKRNGGVLIGTSIREFFKWYEAKLKETSGGNAS